MSSSSGIGLSSSTSIFSGGLCSGNTRRPSMFTAKYRLREERKRVLKLSLNKVRRIEDPESFLRRSVLINNTVKRLQREVREEKMMRNGGYTSKLNSMHSFRKSFASSRLQELVHADDLIDDTSSIIDSSPYSPPILSNSRKRPLTDESDSDVEAVLSQIYIPPTPCIISAIEEGDQITQEDSLACLSSGPDGEIKKPRMSTPPDEDSSSATQPHLSFISSSNQIQPLDQLEIDVDVVEDGGNQSDWSNNNSSCSSRTQTLNSESLDEVMDEFRLDFHLTSPNPPINSSSGSENSCDEMIKSSDETKENACESISTSSPCCPSGLPNSPLTDHPIHQQKCPNSVNSSVNTENTNSPEKQQFSSCGHSSIFGELQSVVFHSLITSLET